MLWEVEIRPLGRDSERERVCDEFDLLTHDRRGGDLVTASARGYLLDGKLTEAQVIELCNQLLVDPLVEQAKVAAALGNVAEPAYTVLLKPGVMDPTAESVIKAARDLGLQVESAQTFRRYFAGKSLTPNDRETLFRKVLANDAIEQVITGSITAEHVVIGRRAHFVRVSVVPIRTLSDTELIHLSKNGMLALTLDEMRTIQEHFRTLDRDPTDCELETIAQTWSEHCSHKTLKGEIAYTETIKGQSTTTHYKNMLKETVFAATQTIRQQLGANDWCVSVFADNAGVVRFNEQFHLCIKVETHNRPSAIEPYGGANTGLGGVIRDVLGTALGGKPIANTDVFCFARPDYEPAELPPGVLHPRRVMLGVVAGVRDYGNRMGIPTVNGSVYFDDRYLANPLVFCGTVGLIPVGKEHKQVNAGDLIVAVGGRTGRDGIHGATFSSEGLTEKSEVISGGAVQIGNAIAEKKVLDVILQARDRGLFTAITDCGAGGFSSAVGEMGADLGANVELKNAPLKYDGLSYTEIWISESQERMVLAVPPTKWEELRKLCASEDVEAAVLGTFEATGKLSITYDSQLVAELDMHFLHEGRPQIVRQAVWSDTHTREPQTSHTPLAPQEALLRILASWSVCSKEWIVRQYDHEVQGGSVIKPLVGVKEDGPSDAAVVMPILGEVAGVAIANGLCPRYADLDPWAAAASAIDEAMRNVVAVGGDPARTAILDNFCWGNVTEPEMLGALVRTAEACREVAIAYGTPFVSGKDSLNNQFKSPTKTISIPHTLLVSAMARVADVTKCVTMDFKEPGNDVYLVGVTHDELGGSHYHLVTGQVGGQPPRPNLATAPATFAAVHRAITAGLVRACHDLSEGGLAAALAEMAFAGGVGADVTELRNLSGSATSDESRLFSESTTRFVIEAKPDHAAELKALFANVPCVRIGVTIADPRLRIAGSNGEWLIWAKLSELKEAWQKPLRW